MTQHIPELQALLDSQVGRDPTLPPVLPPLALPALETGPPSTDWGRHNVWWQKCNVILQARESIMREYAVREAGISVAGLEPMVNSIVQTLGAFTASTDRLAAALGSAQVGGGDGAAPGVTDVLTKAFFLETLRIVMKQPEATERT